MIVWRMKETGRSKHHFLLRGQPKTEAALCGTKPEPKWRRVRNSSDTCNACHSIACCKGGVVEEMPPPKPRKRGVALPVGDAK